MHGVGLIRPFLDVRRVDVLAYLQQLGQLFREDATNRDPRFTRNRLRHELLPQLVMNYNPRVVDALSRLARLAGEAQQVIESVVDEIFPKCTQSGANHLVIRCAPLAHRPRYLVREILMAAWRRQGWPEQAMGFAQWDDLANLVFLEEVGQATPGLTLPGGIRACRDGERMIVERHCAPGALGVHGVGGVADDG